MAATFTRVGTTLRGTTIQRHRAPGSRHGPCWQFTWDPCNMMTVCLLRSTPHGNNPKDVLPCVHTIFRAAVFSPHHAPWFHHCSRFAVSGAQEIAPSEKNEYRLRRRGRHAGHVRCQECQFRKHTLCDVDENFLRAAEHYPNAKLYRDYREMLDKEHKNLDGITITIPDHMHASVAAFAMERGVNVYCQKPLTQSVWEARDLAKAAKKYDVVTQMGNQGYSSEATRVACEIMWRGALGDITEVHSMSGGGFARDIAAWPEGETAPESINWDLWSGRAEVHPYSAKIHPSNWRGFLDYGSQMIGDWGIHMLGPANWGLQLARADHQLRRGRRESGYLSGTTR